jgi:hypothetical protein
LHHNLFTSNALKSVLGFRQAVVVRQEKLMKLRARSRLRLGVAVMLTCLGTFLFSQTAFACSDFQGNWDDQDALTISNPSNGPSISGA